MILPFYKYLDETIEIKELEQWVYKQTTLEERIGHDHYQFLLAFDYNKKYAKYEIQNFILENIISEKEFASWKMDESLYAAGINFPKDNLYSYARRNPKFLEGKILKLRQLRREKEIEIIWSQEVSPFVRHVSVLDDSSEKYLFLGTYESSYIHLVVNDKNEIWIAYDVLNEGKYFAPNISKAIEKLILGSIE